MRIFLITSLLLISTNLVFAQLVVIDDNNVQMTLADGSTQVFNIPTKSQECQGLSTIYQNDLNAASKDKTNMDNCNFELSLAKQTVAGQFPINDTGVNW